MEQLEKRPWKGCPGGVLGWRKGLGVGLQLGYCLTLEALSFSRSHHTSGSYPQNQSSAVASTWGRVPADVH